jgi:hypothetical protein
MKYISYKEVKERQSWSIDSYNKFYKAFGERGMPIDYDIMLEFITVNGWTHTWLKFFMPEEDSYTFLSQGREEALRIFCDLYGNKKRLVDKIVEQAKK